MSLSAKHRTAGTGLQRAARAAIATAASITSVGLVSQPAAADDNVWDRVAYCESTGNWSINTGNGFYGGLQFWHPTWTGFGGQEFAPYAHQATKLQQITVAQRVLKVQGPGAWPVCSVRAGLTMENGLAPYPGTSTPAPAPAPTPAPPPSTSTSWVVTATAGANIRSGPGTSYAIVGGVAYNTKVSGSLSSGWVRLADGRGYISGAILAPATTSTSPSTMALLVVDGSRGPLTVKAIQRWVGIAETGRWDVATIKALQSKVGTTPDGDWGPKSQAALQTRIGMTRDGSTYMNYRTVVALQKWLNANVLS